jgi:nitroreductase
MNKINFADQFDQIVERRRSMRIYDANAPFDESAIERSLKRAILSPNSSNMQLWEFYWVKDSETHQQLTKASMGQSAVKTARQLVVFVTRRDRWKPMSAWNLDNLKKQFEGKELTSRDKRAFDYYRVLMPLVYRYDWLGISTLVRSAIVFYQGLKKPFLRITNHGDQRVMVHKSCALAAQTFMLSMAAEGYDTCPMEGFDKNMVAKILNLPAAAEICMIVACGPGTPEGLYSERLRVPFDEVVKVV